METTTTEPNEFGNSNVRSKFVFLVYMLLTLEISISFITVLVIKLNYEMEVHHFIESNTLLFLLTIFVVVFISILLTCIPDISRTFPVNYILVTVYVLAFTYLTLALTIKFSTDLVIICMGITLGITTLISLLAKMANIDVSNWYWLILLLCLILLGLGIARVFIFDDTFKLVYAGIALCIFCFFLFYNTRIILSGQHEAHLSSDDYVIGSLMLYTNIMQVLTHVLSLFSEIAENHEPT